MLILIGVIQSVRYFARLLPRIFVRKFNSEDGIGPKRHERLLVLFVSLICVNACSAGPEMVSIGVVGYNHTSAEIIRFSINGAGGPRVPANQGGGSEVCCGLLPSQWSPGDRAIIKWDKDPKPYEALKRDQYGQIVKEAAVRHTASYSHHEATVEIPRYGRDFCALQVHFLPCDTVKVSTTCHTPSSPNYPDSAYFKVKEPTTCSNH
jgi:hypothetical protein